MGTKKKKGRLLSRNWTRNLGQKLRGEGRLGKRFYRKPLFISFFEKATPPFALHLLSALHGYRRKLWNYFFFFFWKENSSRIIVEGMRDSFVQNLYRMRPCRCEYYGHKRINSSTRGYAFRGQQPFALTKKKCDPLFWFNKNEKKDYILIKDFSGATQAR